MAEIPSPTVPLMSDLERMLMGGDKDKIRTFFAFDVDTDTDQIYDQFNIWARWFFPKFFQSKDAPFHEGIDKAEIQLYKGELSTIVNVLFRGAAKTTRKKLFVAFCIANDKKRHRKFYKFLCKDSKNSKQFVTDVYNLLTSRKCAHFYPEIFEKSDAKREETMLSFTTTTGIRLASGSVGTDQRGQIQEESRPDYIIYDDFETRKTLRSAVETQSIFDNMEEARTGLSVEGACSYLCNYLSESGNVHRLLEKHRNNEYSKVFIVPLIKNKGKFDYQQILKGVDCEPTWWYRYSIADCIRILKEAEDPHGEYLCNPSAGADIFFDRASIDKQEPKIPIKETSGFKIFHKFNPSHRYAIGADVGGGVGLDSSASVIIDFSTFPCKVVGTYANNTIIPEDFGYELIRQAEFFGNPLIAVERNFGAEAILVLKQKYRGKIYAPKDKTLISEGTATKYGWHTNTATKPEMLHALKKAVEEGILELSDEDLIRELRGYTRNDLMDRAEDPRLTTRHFDLLMASAIANKMKDEARSNEKKKPKMKIFDRWSIG